MHYSRCEVSFSLVNCGVRKSVSLLHCGVYGVGTFLDSRNEKEIGYALYTSSRKGTYRV